MFFMQSEIQLNDNIMDIFDIDEQTTDLFELERMQDYTKVLRKDTPVSERFYLSVFMRAEN